VITVGERSTCIAVVAAFVVCGALVDPVWVRPRRDPTAGLSFVGLGRLLVVVRRLHGRPAPRD
jgi:hypothetical protein